MAEITFIRHAESTANVDRVFSGRTDHGLSEAGDASLKHLGERLADLRFDLVVSSPLQRARATAESFAEQYEMDGAFLEIDVGQLDGMKFEELRGEAGKRFRRSLSDPTVPVGETGESLRQVSERALAAVDGLAERLGEEGSAAVVTHGGVLGTILHRHLAGKDSRPHAFVENASLNRITWTWGRPRLATFNDTGHFGPHSKTVGRHLEAGEPVVALVRHGRTQANVERRWQGQGDWGLDELGVAQAAALSEWYGRHPTVYSSPLLRAAQTAEQVASNGVVKVEDLKELSMGDWEGLTSEQIMDGWPGRMETIYRDGVDLKRGETGESWGELTARFRGAVHDLTPDQTGVTVVVAHGGAIRSYVSSLTSVRETHAEALFTPPNASVTHVALTKDGPLLLDYAVAPHLETLS